MSGRSLTRAGIAITLIALGVWAGWQTSLLPSAQPFKLLNIAGLCFDLTGVLLLTYVVTSNERLKKFIAEWGGLVAFNLTGVFFISYYSGLGLGATWFGGNDHKLFAYFVPVMISALVSAFFIEDTVTNPRISFLRNTDTRVKFLSGYFVLAGLAIQIYAAFLDLWSGG